MYAKRIDEGDVGYLYSSTGVGITRGATVADQREDFGHAQETRRCDLVNAYCTGTRMLAKQNAQPRKRC